MTSDEREIREYLLGGLAAEELERIDLRIIEDEEYGVEAMAAEDRLIESYLDGELSEEESEQFRTNYLTSEPRAQRVKEFAALRAAVVANDSPVMSPVVEAREDRDGGLFSWLFSLRPAVAMATVGLFAILGAVAWIYFVDKPSSLESEYAALNRQDKTDLSGFSQYSKVELSPGTLRSTDSASKIAIGNQTESIMFRLPLNFDPPPDAIYRALVLRDGKGVFSVYDQRPIRVGSLLEVRVLLPRSIFERGSYQIQLAQLETKAAPVIFNFNVE